MTISIESIIYNENVGRLFIMIFLSYNMVELKVMGISCVMVAHNEELVIERALKSVSGVVDEIILVHDGECNDKTLEIAKKYKARIFVRPWVGIGEMHRPFAYTTAQNNWVLQIDPDEYLSEDLRSNIHKLVLETDVTCYALTWPSWDGEKYITSGWPHKKALFRKDKIKFLGLPHCEVLPQGKTVISNFVLEHKPNYNNFTWSRFRNKWLKWADIHAKMILKNPKEYEVFPENIGIILPRYYLIKKHPILFSIPLGVYHGVLSYWTGGWKMGLMGLKISFMIMCYWASVGWYVYQNSNS